MLFLTNECRTVCCMCMMRRWGRERYVGETKLTQGLHSFGSMRGVSGHIHNPFAGALMVLIWGLMLERLEGLCGRCLLHTLRRLHV
jgi:hypothetical protein